MPNEPQENFGKIQVETGLTFYIAGVAGITSRITGRNPQEVGEEIKKRAYSKLDLEKRSSECSNVFEANALLNECYDPITQYGMEIIQQGKGKRRIPESVKPFLPMRRQTQTAEEHPRSPILRHR